MVHITIQNFRSIHEIYTKEDLFQWIRFATAAGCFFEIKNYYQGGKSDRAAYMVNIVGNKA